MILQGNRRGTFLLYVVMPYSKIWSLCGHLKMFHKNRNYVEITDLDLCRRLLLEERENLLWLLSGETMKHEEQLSYLIFIQSFSVEKYGT